jgi:RNA polymerase sigma-70 factor (ECF subfamily)
VDGIQLTGVKAIARTFDDFYRSEFTRVYRAAWLLARHDEDALDATQEAFGRAYARWRRLSRHEWATGWVITTALNILKRRPGPASGPHGPSSPAREPTPDAIDLQRALQRLPRRQREAVVLFYVGDLTIHVAADLMGVSDGTVKAHLAQGRAALRQLLEVRDD